MDSPDECSGIESVNANIADIEGVPSGSCSSSDACENTDVFASPYDANDDGDEIGHLGGSPPGTAQSACGLTPLTTKGYGLKKWRRIRRDVIKDGNSSLDESKILKRGHCGSGNLAKPVRAPLEIGKDSEGSTGSTSVTRNPSVVEIFAGPSGLDLNFAAGPSFAAGEDSDHSEDWSSKSSTAASAPKARYDSLCALGHARERNRAKNLSGKGSGQQGKTPVESTKKLRGARVVKLQKENSQSSMESDLRRSNSINTQGAFSTAINGMKSGKSTSYYSGNNDKAHQSGQYSDDAHARYLKENSLDGENISQDDGSAPWEAEEDKDENHRSSADQDPLFRSMQALLSVQEALGKEVKKFTEIAKDPVVTIAEGQMSDLTEHVKSLEVTLEETKATLLASESRISELEAALRDPRSLKEESRTDCDLLTSKPMDELENAFRQKIEAEIEYLAIVRTIQALRVDLQSQLMLLAKQEAVEQTASHDKLCEVENRAAQLEKRAEELEEVCEVITEVEDDVLKLERGACKATSWFLLQLFLLVLVIWLLILRLSPHEAEFVPT